MADIKADIDAAGSQSLVEIIEKAGLDKDENAIYPLIQENIERKTYTEREMNRNLETPLILACKYAMPKIAELLIRASVSNINQVSKDKSTALIYSCKNALDSVTRLLLEKGANTLQIDNSGVSAFAYSCLYGNEEISLEVLEKTNTVLLDNLFIVEKGSYTVLMIACLRGFDRIIAALLKRKVAIHTLNAQGMTAISYSLFFGKEEMVLTLLSKTSVIHYNKIVKHGGVSYTYLSAAARLKLFDVVKFLVETQKHDKKDILNLIYVNNEGYHFLDYFFTKSLEYIKIKIGEATDLVPEKKAKMTRELVNKFDNLAAEVCSLYKDANLFIPLHKHNTALIYAAKCGYEKTIMHLLERLKNHPQIYRPYINIYNSDNNTALFYLFPTDDTIFTREMQKRVLHDAMNPFYKHIDYKISDSNGNTLMMHAILRGRFDFVISLLENHKESREYVKQVNNQNGNNLLHCIENYFSVKYGIPSITNSRVFEEYKAASREAKQVVELAIDISPELLSMKNMADTNIIMVCSILYDGRDLLERVIQESSSSLDINEFNDKHMNPLLYSCIFKNENAIYLLSLENIKYNPIGNYESPFSIACYSNNDKVAMEFLKRDDLNVDTADEDGNTPLINACMSGLEDLALEIIERNPESIYAINIHYMRPFHFAVMSKSQRILDKIQEVHSVLNPVVEDATKNEENLFKRGSMFYCENRKIHDYISGEEMALEDYLEEDPENMYFEILTDDLTKGNATIYGLTTKTKMITALNPNSTNSYFYGCKKAVNNFMTLYNSGDPDQQEEARSFVDLNRLYIYMLPLMGIPGLISPELVNILSLDLNRHRCFGLIKVDSLDYESIVNSLVIHSSSFYSTSTTHCEPMTKPYVYVCFPMEPKSNRKRKRTPDIASMHIAESPKSSVIHISYKDKVYDIPGHTGKITFPELRELVIEKLVAEGKLGENAINAKIRFLYLGKMYTIDEKRAIGEAIPGFDSAKAFNILAQVVGGRRPLSRQSRRKKHRYIRRKTRRQ